MSGFFSKKYNGPVGRIFDAWGQDRINQEIGNIYEEHVFGKPSIDMNELLNEFHGKATGGKIDYTGDLNYAVKKGVIKG